MNPWIYRLLCLFLPFSLSLNAQTSEEVVEIKTHSNIYELNRIGNEFKTKRDANYKKALKYALQKKWPIKISLPGGSYKELQGITEDLQPIYYLALNAGAGITARANKLYTGGGLGLNVHGESMTAGVWDGMALRFSHEAYESRAVAKDSAVYMSDRWHATHVAGTIMASDQFQNGRARGIAFKANVHAYDWGNDLREITDAAANGLLLSNHSYISEYLSGNYGTVNDGYYVSFYGNVSANLDKIMYNAPYYLSIWSAGNGGGPADKLGNTASHKNGIAVAAVLEVANYTGAASVVPWDFSTGGTSRGPTDDGRIKPDISAKGRSVYSTGGDITNNHIMTDVSYISSSGTSMASPGVTGTLLLLQQHFTNLHPLNFMRASTLKGLALHTADEAGLNPGPDITFGWGLINAEKAANVITNNGGVSYLSEDSLANGTSYLRELVASGTEPLIATISWTDLPGTATAIDNDPTPKLVNDLDLRVVSNGTTYYPWKLDLSNVTGPAIQGDNDRDNIEKIEIPNPVAGQVYTLQVNHKGTLALNGQRFSVIVTGLEECVANRNIVSSVNAISVDHQQASARILATNTVNADAEAVYHAGDEVLMTDGFTAISGSTYRAYIENCTNDYAARKAVVERPVVTYNIPRPKEEIALADNAVYPNPGNGMFYVRVAGLSEGFVQITNLKGTEFYNRKFKDQGELDVNIKNEAPGMYIVRVVSGNKVYTKTIVKF